MKSLKPEIADEPPPFLKSWRRVYFVVLLYLALLIITLLLITRAFAPSHA